MNSIVLVIDAFSCIGKLSARSLALAGHTVYAGLREFTGRHAEIVRELRYFAAKHGIDLRLLTLDLQSQASVDLAVDLIYRQQGRLDVVVYDTGHVGVGPVEAFTPEEMANAFDINVLGPQRINRAVLPRLRTQRHGLLLWTASTPPRGGHSPFMGPYTATKAAIDSLAVDYAYEVARFGIETSIVVPGVFTSSVAHSPRLSKPADTKTCAVYDAHYQDVLEAVRAQAAASAPNIAEPQAVADEVTRVIGLPQGRRPFRTVVDFVGDGVEADGIGGCGRDAQEQGGATFSVAPPC